MDCYANLNFNNFVKDLQNLAPQTPLFQAEAQEVDSAINSSLDSALDSATQSTQNTHNLQQPQNLQTPQTQTSTISQTLTSIKTKIFVYVVLLVIAGFFSEGASELLDSWDSTKRNFGAILAVIAVGCGISAFISLYLAMRNLWQVAKSRILQTTTHAFIITLIVSVLLGVILGRLINEIFVVILVGGLIYCFILRYRIYKEVAYITNQPLFMIAFWLSIITGGLSVIAERKELFGVMITLNLIYLIIYITAWIMVKDIRLSMSAGNMMRNIAKKESSLRARQRSAW